MKNLNWKYFLILVSLVLLSIHIQAQNGWTKKTNIPTPTIASCAAVVNDKIYVLGGGVFSDYNDNQVYDPSTDSWEKKQPMGYSRGLLSAAVVNDTIYAIGGSFNNPTSIVEAYDPVTDAWTGKANMLAPRFGAAAGVVDGIIYNVGGNHTERNCEAYDPATDIWTRKADIPETYGGISVAPYGELLYAIGGGFDEVFQTVYSYDPKTDEWTKKANMPTARGWSHPLPVVDGKIYFIGGYKSVYGETLSDVEVYDPVLDSWTKLPDAPFKLAMFGAAVVNDKIYIIGGTSDWTTGRNEVWEYDPAFQIQNKSFIFEKIMRDYNVFLPKSYNGSTKMPVVFNLHGYTLDKVQQMNYSQMNTIADTAGFIVVYPNAIDATWNCGISWGPNVNDVGFIDTIIDTLSILYSIDKTRIYSCGFSRGGFMSNRLACELNNRIAAFAAVGGTMVKSLASNYIPGRHVPILYFHGTDDPIVLYNGDDERQAVDTFITHWTKFNLCTESDTTFLPNSDTLDGCTVQRITNTNSSDSTRVIFYKILNGGHTWPGGNPNYLVIPGFDVGRTNFDINASEIMWDFFKDYTLSEPTSVKNKKQFPLKFSLSQNYPNPFNPATSIEYRVASTEYITLKVYDVLGREVATLVNEEKHPGSYDVVFDGSELSSGIYFYKIQAGNFVETKKMILLK